jgi:post-segregation antitoxin (ccd killing protein)
VKQNITLSLDKDLIQKAKVLSAKRHTSVSTMLSQELKRIVESVEQYEVAKRKAISDLRNGYHLGGLIAASREELHERKSM